MARAETIEHVGETGSGGNGPNTCQMELPRPFPSWPGLLTTNTITTTGTEAQHLHLRYNHHHHYLHPHMQALHLPYPLPYPHPQGQEQTQNHQQFPALSPSPTPPPSPPCSNQGEERGGGPAAPSAFSGVQSDSDREASSRQGPLPDLLPQNERPSWASPRHRAPAREAALEMEVRRVAHQLRSIGDELHATVLHRAHDAPHWQDWRDACRGLFNFIAQTLSTLYRLT